MYSSYTGVNQGDALSLLFFNFALEYATRKDWKWMEHSSWSLLMILIYWVKI